MAVHNYIMQKCLWVCGVQERKLDSVCFCKVSSYFLWKPKVVILNKWIIIKYIIKWNNYVKWSNYLWNQTTHYSEMLFHHYFQSDIWHTLLELICCPFFRSLFLFHIGIFPNDTWYHVTFYFITSLFMTAVTALSPFRPITCPLPLLSKQAEQPLATFANWVHC